ncbi:unnamed protein product [Adineta steineri]|uniref:Uncharacterized protein n=1 Tax=Adineta steineri TaxID=433720 RepID=A0A814H1Y4_9BILA|nr:unnamed protein product [Adineta steineri]CAF1391316.1 unnamed protein product [Adineta steineri]CAF1392693.1 unnamed protein product [Adineta steineri]
MDKVCSRVRELLCPRDELMKIATTIRSISRALNEIEENILISTTINETLHRYIDFEIGHIQSVLPTRQYHAHFFKNNNINKTYLIDLLLEAHDAMSFYYNSIEDILKIQDAFGLSSNTWFRQVKLDLQNKVICPYRNVLNVYSSQWPIITEINRIKFSPQQYRNTPSILHDVRSIIIVRLLRQWITVMHPVIINIERKFR